MSFIVLIIKREFLIYIIFIMIIEAAAFGIST